MIAKRPLISIVTPCYNEELNVDFHFAEVQKNISSFRDRYDFEHIYTDNCSHDQTFEKLSRLTEQNSNVRAMRFARNIGADNAIYFALQQARGDAVIVIQADLQDPPHLLPEFIRGWEEGNDVVFGQIQTRGEIWMLRRFRNIFYWLIDKFGEVSIPQNAGEFRLCSRRAVDALLTFEEQEIYLRGAVAMVGFRQKAVPYVRAPRRAGGSSVNLSYLFSYAINGMVSTTLAPIRLVTIIGFLVAALGFILTCLTVLLKVLFPGVAPRGFTTLAVLITLFSGIQMLATGVIGEYLRKTYKQSLHRPRGFIADKVGEGWADPTAVAATPVTYPARTRQRSTGQRHPIVQEDVDRILEEDLPWDRFDGATVLVTGASGFLATYVVETLLARNERRGALDAYSPGRTRVLAMVRHPDKAYVRYGHVLDRSDLEIRIGDVTEPVTDAGPIDFIVHAASLATPKIFGVDPVGTLLPNAVGTHHLLELGREKGAQGFLFLSSGEIYGALDADDVPTPESHMGRLDPASLRSSYAEGKRVGESLCVAYAHQHSVPARIVRLFHTYGPGMGLDDGRVFSDFVGDLVACRDIVMRSVGGVVRSYCYVADATRGLFAALLKGEDAQPYNIGNPMEELSVLELAEKLVAAFPERKLKVVRGFRDSADSYLESPVPRSSPNISKLKALGWKPEVATLEGFRRTVRSFEPVEH